MELVVSLNEGKQEEPQRPSDNAKDRGVRLLGTFAWNEDLKIFVLRVHLLLLIIPILLDYKMRICSEADTASESQDWDFRLGISI